MSRFKPGKNQISTWTGTAGILCLFLALLLVIINLESRVAGWSRWWPLVLIQLSCIVLWFHNPEKAHIRPVHWVVLLILSSHVFCLISLIMLDGLLPHEGLREAQDLILIWFCCVGLWYHALYRPSQVPFIWSMLVLLPIALENLVSLVHSGECLAFRPDYWTAGRIIGLVISLSGLLAASVIWSWNKLKQPSLGSDSDRRMSRTGLLLTRLCFLVAGVVAGWSLHTLQQYRSTGQEIVVQRGLDAIKYLWIQSTALGWGHNTLASLVDIVTLPHAAKSPEWAGPAGYPATHGYLGVGFLICLAIMLCLRGRRKDIKASCMLADLSETATCITLFLVSLVLAGGPRGPLPLLLLFGWLALSLTRSPFQSRGHHSGFTFTLPLLVAIVMAGITLVTYGPIKGQVLFDKLDDRHQPPERFRLHLQQARKLNRYDSRIPVALANSWQRSMTRSPGWQEDMFNQVDFYYREASRLDPYDTLITMRHANFLLKCERRDAAIATARKALAKNPHSSDLATWLFLVAIRHDYLKLAFEILDYGIRLEPYNPWWWKWRYRLTARLGQGPLARQSLAVALTGNPENPELISRSWDNLTNDMKVIHNPSVPVLEKPHGKSVKDSREDGKE